MPVGTFTSRANTHGSTGFGWHNSVKRLMSFRGTFFLRPLGFFRVLGTDVYAAAILTLLSVL
ncbi:MAG: hypothetical protein WBC70_06000, partial [Candidatus Aminicenantales bacterium]